MSDNPDERRYGPWIVFLIVIVIFSWALALRRLGAK